MSKKIIALALALLLCFSLVACGKSEKTESTAEGKADATAAPAETTGQTEDPADKADNGAKGNKLTIWCWDKSFNVYAMEQAAEIYKKDHPDVEINIQEVAWDDVQTRITAAVNGKQLDTLPDITLMQDYAILKNVENYPGVFADLTNSGIDYSQFTKYKTSIATVDGKIYNVPFDNGATAFFLRTDILEEAGLTAADFDNATWQDVIDKGKIVKEKTGKPMITTMASQPDIVSSMLQSAGEGFFKEDGSVFIKDNAVLKEAMELYTEMVKSGVMVEYNAWDQYIQSINTGETVGVFQGCWIIGSITAQEDQKGKWTMVKTPKMPKSDSVNYSNNGGSGWVVFENSPNKELAIDFLKNTFAGSKELYDTILPSSGAIATWIPAGQSSVYDEPQPFFGDQKIYVDLVDYAANIPSFVIGKYQYEARDAIGNALSRMIQKGEDVDTALKQAEEDVAFQMD